MRLRILLNICLTFVDFQPLLLIKVLLIKKKRVVQLLTDSSGKYYGNLKLPPIGKIIHNIKKTGKAGHISSISPKHIRHFVRGRN